MKWFLPMILAMVFVVGLSFGLLLTPLIPSEDGVKVAMWLEVAHRLCTSVGGLGTFVALIIVLRQFYLLRTQSELVQKNIVASMEGQLYARLDSFNKVIVEHYKEYAMLDQPYERGAPPDDRPKLHHLCELGFTFFEEIFKHHSRLKLLETEDWDEWEQNMNHFFIKPYVRGYWGRVSGRYSKSFQLLMNELVMKLESKSPLSGVTRDPAA